MSKGSQVYLMGIDLGAGSLKATVIDRSGAIAGSASRDVETYTPHPGWSEQDPSEWWAALCQAVPAALARANVRAADLRAVSFSAGAHTPVLTDHAGRVLRPAILWSDQRSGLEAAELNERAAERILAVGLNRPSATWTMPQLLWLRRNEPDVVERTARVFVAKDWLRCQLTGGWETDVTDAIGTLLYDCAANQWSGELCDLIGWRRETLPPVVRPADQVGAVTADAGRATGLAAGTPVVCGTSDTSVEAYAAGAVREGLGTVKLATAGTISIIGTEPNVHPTLINYPFAIPGLWYTITGTNGCASAHRWLRDRFFMYPGADGKQVFDEMDRLAATVAPGADGLLFHPYLQGERAPYWDPLLRADFVGMTMRHQRAHFVRALYEGIAFSLREVLEQFRARGMDLGQARIIGGGATSPTWRQIMADVLGIRILLPANTDASYGAALLAGVGVGVFADEQEAGRHCERVTDVAEPDPARRERYQELFGLYKETQQRLHAINHRLHDFAVRGVPADG
jgi:xylulokinase